MNGSARRGHLGLLRAPFVMILLGGLFAMHGLTANHDVAGPAAAGAHPAAHVRSAMTADLPTPAQQIGSEARAVVTGPSLAASVIGAVEAMGHGMAGACVAILVGSVLLLLLRAGQARGTRGPIGGRADIRSCLLAIRGSPPAHLTPSLPQLGVLRC